MSAAKHARTHVSTVDDEMKKKINYEKLTMFEKHNRTS